MSDPIARVKILKLDARMRAVDIVFSAQESLPETNFIDDCYSAWDDFPDLVELGSFTWLGVGSSGSFDSVLVGKIAPLIRGTVEAVFTYESGVQVGLMIQDGRVAKCGVELRLVKPEGWE